MHNHHQFQIGPNIHFQKMLGDRLWPRLRKYAKQEEISSGLNRIRVPVYDDQGAEVFEFRSITKPSEIQRNKQHFPQSKNTLLVEGIFGDKLPPFQQNNFSESILNGSIDLQHFNVPDEGVKACICEMKYAKGEPGQDTISSEITVVEEFQQGFKRVSNFFFIRYSHYHHHHHSCIQ